MLDGVIIVCGKTGSKFIIKRGKSPVGNIHIALEE